MSGCPLPAPPPFCAGSPWPAQTQQNDKTRPNKKPDLAWASKAHPSRIKAASVAQAARNAICVFYRMARTKTLPFFCAGKRLALRKDNRRKRFRIKASSLLGRTEAHPNRKRIHLLTRNNLMICASRHGRSTKNPRLLAEAGVGRAVDSCEAFSSYNCVLHSRVGDSSERQPCRQGRRGRVIRQDQTKL